MNPHTPTVNDSSYNYKVPVEDFLFREAVVTPKHYQAPNDPLGIYETIKVINAWGCDFCLGNALKYISRAGKKPGEQKVKDLEKAAYYINKSLENARNEMLQEQFNTPTPACPGLRPNEYIRPIEHIKATYSVSPEPVRVITDGLTVTPLMPKIADRDRGKPLGVTESVGITSTTIKNG